MINFVNNAPFAGGGDIAYINDTIDSQKQSFVLGFEPKYAILNFYIQIYNKLWFNEFSSSKIICFST